MRVLALLLALLCTASAVNVRVLVASGPAVRIRVPISTSVGLQPQPAPTSFADWNVTVHGQNLALNGQDSTSPSLYLPPAEGSVVRIGNTDYRGGVLLRATNGAVQAINVVDLEDYLRGVVPSEMPASWPIEALKAQAVIARTYAAARINSAAAYDLCATEQCQVYTGLTREAPGSDAAIAQTRDLVVSWSGGLARTYFSADSGGYTASAGEVWGNDLPYLVAQPDPASRGPKSSWSLSVPLAKVTQVAARYRVHVGPINNVQITRYSNSGRPLEIVFGGAQGTARISGAEAGGFVRALGAFSSRVAVSGLDPLVVTGAGHGHGVGLSQWGASGLAAQSWNYAQILGFYYPGAAMSTLVQGADATPESAAGAAFASVTLGATFDLPRADATLMAALGGQDVE